MSAPAWRPSGVGTPDPPAVVLDCALLGPQCACTKLAAIDSVMAGACSALPYAFTQADRSLSFGASFRGADWGREADTLGLASATNALSSPQREVVARGGLTFFLGDGWLNHAPERIVEAYYAWKAAEPLTLSWNLQRIQNPGYNADRGPVNFLGLRAHLEF